MSSLIGKRIGGQTYYYLREVARVGGRPKIVSQRYLGKAGDIAAAMDGVTVLPERLAGRRIGVVGVLSLRSIVTGSEASPCLCPVLSYV